MQKQDNIRYAISWGVIVLVWVLVALLLREGARLIFPRYFF
jgi:hypothetical protein